MRIGSIVLFHCPADEIRPAMVIDGSQGEDRDGHELDLIVFVMPEDAFELGVASAMFTQEELDACAAPRRGVKRGTGVGEWSPRDD